MRSCANCAQELKPTQSRQGISYNCAGCGGLLIGVSVLQSQCDAQAIQRLWVRAKQANRPVGKRCPECKAAMLVVRTPPEHGAIEVDTCPRCYLIWLDRGELEKLPKAPANQVRSAEREIEKRKEHERRERLEKSSRTTGVDRDEDFDYIDAIITILTFWL